MRQIFILTIVLFWACGSEPESETPAGPVQGYKPVYADPSTLAIRVGDARSISTAGKIYSYGNLLLVNEVSSGIHVYDNTDPKHPVNRFFVTVPGSGDMAIKNGILYVDSYNDLLALEVTADTVIELKRFEGFMELGTEYPPVNNSYFECVDESKGAVIGWELVELSNPKCFRP